MKNGILSYFVGALLATSLGGCPGSEPTPDPAAVLAESEPKSEPGKENPQVADPACAGTTLEWDGECHPENLWQGLAFKECSGPRHGTLLNGYELDKSSCGAGSATTITLHCCSPGLPPPPTVCHGVYPGGAGTPCESKDESRMKAEATCLESGETVSNLTYLFACGVDQYRFNAFYCCK